MNRPTMLVPLLIGAVALGACTAKPERAPQVATAGGAAVSASPAADDAEQRRRFTACMRENGVEMPDPGQDGRLTVKAEKPGEGGDPVMNTAMEKCRPLLPNGGEPPRMTPEDIEKARAMAKCMRENGVPGFPDPDPVTGGLRIEQAPGADEQAIEKAMQKCGPVGPDGVGAVQPKATE